MYDEKSLTGRLNTLYNDSRMTNDKFAEICGVSGSAMQNYLKGTRPFPSAKIPKVCAAFSVSADWLLGLSDVRKPSTDLRGVCEYTGISEEAIKKIEEISQEDEYIKDVISRVIESSRFDNVIYRLYVYLANVDAIKESDFDDDIEPFNFENEKVSLPRKEAIRYFKEGVKESVGNLCNDLYIQCFQRLRFTKAPAKIRLVSADEIVYMPVKGTDNNDGKV